MPTCGVPVAARPHGHDAQRVRARRALISPFRGLERLHLPDDVMARVECPTLFIWASLPVRGEDAGRQLVARIARPNSR